jgi:copper transport protein
VLRLLPTPTAALLTLLLAVAWAPAALAHASLLATDPPDGAVLAAAPTTVILRFNEPVSPTIFRLVMPDGTSTELTQLTASDAAVRILLPSPLAQGTHLVSWRVVSADGHPVGGSLVFSIGASSSLPHAGTLDAALVGVHRLLWLAKLGLYLGLFVGVGGAFSRAILTARGDLPRLAERIIAGAILVGAVATVAHVCLQGLDLLDRPLAEATAPESWAAGLSGGAGLLALLALLSQSLAFASFVADGRARRFLTASAMVALGLALASTGHAANAPPQAVTRPAVFLHVVSIAFWIGALLPLGWLFAVAHADRRLALVRFSRAIPWSVVLLVLAGVALACIQLKTFRALWTTAYGAILSLKLGLVAALLAVAAWNRYRLTPLLLTGQRSAERRFGQTVGLELVLVVAILCLVGGWRFTPPPRALHPEQAATLPVHMHGPGAIADLEVTLDRGTPSAIMLRLTKDGRTPLDAREVVLLLDNPGEELEAIKRTAERRADGTWSITGLSLPSAETWRLRIDVLVSDFEKIRLESEVSLPRLQSE